MKSGGLNSSKLIFHTSRKSRRFNKLINIYELQKLKQEATNKIKRSISKNKKSYKKIIVVGFTTKFSQTCKVVAL